ncbi:hypothetical protein IQ251_04450 [Saccharopolyspora sp. HNM0983]|uniref:Uncharacterized protein n=1 Tax=Saccharopolyspora montiporae TaxID=2781240 RepID=A0A929B5R6_9PSEU|nr:hypothetical protein [Saccharopolyspora sp. HNM0983]MBE9373697.1 hypothetical protein [Saccharopolyspora sp. HNM0983]
MLHSLVIGLGRAGAGLHLPVLAKARAAAPELFHAGPPIACDRAVRQRPRRTDAAVVDTPAAAARIVPPERTVVHVCTPPGQRLRLLTELADLGFDKLIVEKPLAADDEENSRIGLLRGRRGLRIAVVAHWLESALTARLRALVAGQEHGALVGMTFQQDKPRFRRSAATTGHPTAFDVEVPHSVGVALDLAGPAEVADARCTDMHLADRTLPGLGAADLELRHLGGATTRIRSDLTSPVQRRSVELTFTGGRVLGHYPISEHDDHAQLLTAGADARVLRDDALTSFLVRTYRTLGAEPAQDTFALHSDVVRIIAEAKRRSAARALPERTVHEHAG